MRSWLATPFELLFLLFWLTGISCFAQNISAWKEFEEQGATHYANEDFAAATISYEKAWAEAKKNFRSDDMRLSTTSLHLSLAYLNGYDFKKAEAQLINTQNLFEVNKTTECVEYAETMRSLAQIYMFRNQHSKAEAFFLPAKDILARLKPGSNELALVYQNLGFLYGMMEMEKKAIPLFQASMDISRNLEDKAVYEESLEHLAHAYTRLGQFYKAMPLLEEKRALSKQVHSSESIAYAQSLVASANLYRLMGLNDKALPLQIEGLEILKKENSKEYRYFYALNLNYLGDIYSLGFGQYEKALPIYIAANQILVETVGKKHRTYSGNLNSLAYLYMMTGNNEKGEELFQEALKLDIENNDNQKLSILINLGILYFKKGDLKRALDIQYQALDIAKQRQLTESYIHGKLLNNLGITYSSMGDYQKALPLLLEGLEKMRANNTNESLYFPIFLNNLGQIYTEMGLVNEATSVFLESNPYLRNTIKRAFRFGSESDRKQYMQNIGPDFEIYQTLEYLKNAPAEITEMNLNDLYLRKGLLLNTTKDIFSAVFSLSNPAYSEKIAEYQSTKNELNRALASNNKEAAVSLKQLSENLEGEITGIFAQNFPNQLDLDLKWTDVRNELLDNEAVVEFSSFKPSHGDEMGQNVCVAYVFTKKSTAPKMIRLFNEKNLSDLLKQKNRGAKATNSVTESNRTQIYDLIWRPLEKEIGSAKTIFFSPDGLLHQVPFVTLGKDKNHLLVDSFNLIQLSSTAQIPAVRSQPASDSILFIGGIVYDYNSVGKKAVANTTETEKLYATMASRGADESWDYLSGTLTEIENIESIFKEKNRKFTSLKGNFATESALKQLSGNSPSILHIATHGFFFENIKNPKKREAETNPYILSEDPLMRSGLIMAGANLAWLNGNNPYEPEDGILTSLEISSLDLSKTDMVVLSACDTGLGDIDGSEGVYGLQRAFKMAGVKIVVMNLWQVPDAETAEFMQLFYVNWLDGKPVREAFSKAQKTMCRKYPDEPVKWAGFVLFE